MGATTATDRETLGVDHKTEAKSRFSNALNEAKAGAAALKAEAFDRGNQYKERANEKGDQFKGDAAAYGDQAKAKASDYAYQGKAKASEGLTSLSRMINDNAATLDEKLGPKYGDYARSASRSLEEQAAKLDSKSIEELTEDTRTYIRSNPGTAVGIAAATGYMLARLFRSGK
ncbi:hypothetical protein JD971_15390 [Croceicoccus sp. YJ47]|nr:hypothetical protein JD971_15390 [Croceicoccus sp. YJ47]